MIKKNLICVSNKVLYLGIIILTIIVVFAVFYLANKKNILFKAKAGGMTFCEANGLNDVANPTLLNIYTQSCLQNNPRPIWNYAFGDKAKCLTKDGVCADAKRPDCDQGNCLTMCLFRPVDMSVCVDAGVAPIYAETAHMNEFKCPESLGGSPIYAWGGSNSCYEMNGRIIGLFDGTQPYCVSTPVDVNLCRCNINNDQSACAFLTATPIPPTPITSLPTNILSPTPFIAIRFKLNGNPIMYGDEPHNTKGTYYITLSSTYRTDASAGYFPVFQYVDGQSDIYSGFACWAQFDNTGNKKIENIIGYKVHTTVLPTTTPGPTNSNGTPVPPPINANTAYCIQQQQACGPFTIQGKQQWLPYGQLYWNTTNYVCGCDTAGKYRYSTLITPTPAP